MASLFGLPPGCWLPRRARTGNSKKPARSAPVEADLVHQRVDRLAEGEQFGHGVTGNVTDGHAEVAEVISPGFRYPSDDHGGAINDGGNETAGLNARGLSALHAVEEGGNIGVTSFHGAEEDLT